MMVSKARQTLAMEVLSKSWGRMVVEGSLKGGGQANLPEGVDQQQVCRMIRWHYLYAK